MKILLRSLNLGLKTLIFIFFSEQFILEPQSVIGERNVE